MTDERPTHLDLFSGIGGFALAAQWAGFRTIGFCEIDKYCQKVLAKNFNVHSNGEGEPALQINDEMAVMFSDIRDLNGRDFTGVSLITGGFPCQPFSVAGKRRGAADDRALWPQMFRVISEARPAWVLGENVPGIVQMELDNVLSDLESIGYATRPFVIPACAVDARHRRDRVWIVGHATWDEQRGLRRTRIGVESASATRQAGGTGQDAANAESQGLERFWTDPGREKESELGNGGALVESYGEGCEYAQEMYAGRGITREGKSDHRTFGSAVRWLPEPDVGGNFDGLSSWLDGRGEVNEKNLGGLEDLCALWDAVLAEAIQWSIRGFVSISPQAILFALLCKHEKWKINEAWLLMAGKKALEAKMRGLWFASAVDCPSCGSRHGKQQSRKHSDALQVLSRLLARDAEKVWIAYRRSDASPVLGWETGYARIAHGVNKRVDRLKGLGNAIVPQVTYEILREIRKLI